MPSGLYYLNRSRQTEGLKITYLIFCGRTPEVRNAGCAKSWKCGMPEVRNARRTPEVRNSGRTSKERQKNTAHRVKMAMKKSDKREGSILKLGCSMTISYDLG